jgi:hypothetical protein
MSTLIDKKHEIDCDDNEDSERRREWPRGARVEIVGRRVGTVTGSRFSPADGEDVWELDLDYDGPGSGRFANVLASECRVLDPIVRIELQVSISRARDDGELCAAIEDVLAALLKRITPCATLDHARTIYRDGVIVNLASTGSLDRERTNPQEES